MIVSGVMNNLISDKVLQYFTYKGESKLETKTYKLSDYKNICNLFKGLFDYAALEKVNKYHLPLHKDVQKSLSYTVRHAKERVVRQEKNKQTSTKEMGTDA